jgi:hypothetical protein
MERRVLTASKKAVSAILIDFDVLLWMIGLDFGFARNLKKGNKTKLVE